MSVSWLGSEYMRRVLCCVYQSSYRVACTRHQAVDGTSDQHQYQVSKA